MPFRRYEARSAARAPGHAACKATAVTTLSLTAASSAGGASEPVLAKRRTAHGSGLGVFRWVVERTLSWLHQNRRLRTRYERRGDTHEALVDLGCAMICWNVLHRNT